MNSSDSLNLALGMAEPDPTLTLLSSAEDLLFGDYSNTRS